MIKDKLHTISDEDARKVGEILLFSSTSSLFNYSFEKISRQEYIEQWGSDAEESVDAYFKATVKNEQYVKAGWKDKTISIQLIESDAFHNYPLFRAYYKEETDQVWKHHHLSNHIEAVEYLQKINLL